MRCARCGMESKDAVMCEGCGESLVAASAISQSVMTELDAMLGDEQLRRELEPVANEDPTDVHDLPSSDDTEA